MMMSSATFESSLFRAFDIIERKHRTHAAVAAADLPEYEQIDDMNAADTAYETLRFLWILSDEQEERLNVCYRAYCRYCDKFWTSPSMATYRQMAEFIKAG